MSESVNNSDRLPDCQADAKIGSLAELLDFDFDRYGIEGLIFDYGGTIDTHGEHWSDVIYCGYKAAGLNIPHDVFWDAYVYAERELARHPHILPTDNFHDLLTKKIAIEIGQIQLAIDNGQLTMDNGQLTMENGELSIFNCQFSIVNHCYSVAAACVAEAKPVLEALASRFPMVMVSNFYGNLNAVLEDFGIRHCFKAVIESAVVGVRKPDPEIFRLGLEAIGLPAHKVLTIGDSLKKDIIPSRHLGIRTVQLISE